MLTNKYCAHYLPPYTTHGKALYDFSRMYSKAYKWSRRKATKKRQRRAAQRRHHKGL